MPPTSEWIAGLAETAQFIAGGTETPWRPHVLMWIDASNELIRGSELDREAALLHGAAASLTRTMRDPMAGEPETPARIRTASPALAAVLREAHLAIEIVEGPTPEFDAILEGMDAALHERQPDDIGWVETGVAPERAAALFDAAAALYRLTPRQRVPSDQSLIGVSEPALGLGNGIVSVIGQSGESFGFVLFDSMADFDRYVDLFADFDPEQPPDKLPTLPPHRALNFERGGDVSAALRREAMQYGWSVADERAWPNITLVEPDLIARPL